LVINLISKVYYAAGLIWLHACVDNNDKDFDTRYFMLEDSTNKGKLFIQYVLGSWGSGILSNYITFKRVLFIKNGILLKWPQTVVFFSQMQNHDFVTPIINVLDSSNKSKNRVYYMNANQKTSKSLHFFLLLFWQHACTVGRLRKVYFKKACKNIWSKI